VSTSAGMRLSTWLLAVGALAPAAFAVKSEDFKTCSQSSFCRRLRSIATRQAEAGNTFTSPYSVESCSTPRDKASWTFPLKSSLYPEVNFELKLDILAKGDGIARVRVDEVGSKTQWKRYDESARWALLDAEPELASLASVSVESPSASVTVLRYGPEGSRLSLQIEHSPLKITQLRAGKPQIILNDRGLFHMEHFRTKEQQEAEQVKVEEGGDQAAFAAGQKIDRKWFEGEPDSELFEERFRKWTDTKPKGE
jgi:alpha 1,3-glucosidase